MGLAAVLEQNTITRPREDNFILIPPLYHTGATNATGWGACWRERATILTEISPKLILETVIQERGQSCGCWFPWAAGSPGGAGQRAS